MNSPETLNAINLKLTSFSHGGGCGCKIAPGILAEILKNLGGFPVPKELLIGIETSDDAAVYKLNDEQALIATTDFFMPIVDDPYDFGRIAAANAISDIYAMGGQPIMALAIVCMPISQLPVEVIAKIIKGGESICAEAGIPIAGGHTIDSVEPIYGLMVMGLAHPAKIKSNAGAQIGDQLILGKPLGVGILSAALKKEKLDDAGYARMIATTTQLNKPGIALANIGGVHALTDVTGFGILGHLLGLTRSAKLNAQLRMSQIPMLPGVMALADSGLITGASARNWVGYGHEVMLDKSITATQKALLTDPQTSGGLLVSCAPDVVEEVLNIFTEQGFAHATVIGEMVAGEGRVAVAS